MVEAHDKKFVTVPNYSRTSDEYWAGKEIGKRVTLADIERMAKGATLEEPPSEIAAPKALAEEVKEAKGAVPEAGLRSDLNVAEPAVAQAKPLTPVARARAFHQFIFQWLILTGLTSLYPTFYVFLYLWGIYPTSLFYSSLWGTVYTRESRSMVIEQVWEESRDYYLDYQKRLIGELLISPVGSIKRRKSWGGWFLYLHKRKGQGFEDVYLGAESDLSVKKIAEKIKNRQRLIRELRSAKNALKLLKANKMSQALKDFTEPLRKLLAAMERLGFFEAGIELIGSYCFKVYQSHFGVEWFPLRTIDIDFAVPIPYKGPPTDLEAVLKELGFRQEFCTDGTIYFEGNGLKIEFLQPRKGSGTKRQSPNIKELSTVPIPLPYLNILLDNKVEVSLRDIGRIALPSLPAFALHKLLIASLAERKAKREKDYIQVCAVAKKIITEKNLIDEVQKIFTDLPQSWRKKISDSARILPKFVGDCNVDFSTLLSSPK